MKLLVDLTYLKSFHAGVNIYAIRILKGMRDNGIKDICLLLHPITAEALQKEFPSFEHIVIPDTASYLINKEWYKIIATGYSNRKRINQMDCDIVFSPFNLPFSFWKLKKKHVRTIHDLQEMKIHSRFWSLCGHIVFPIRFWNSDAIITISNHVKNEILKKYWFASKKNMKKISVAVEMCGQDSSPLLDFEYILCVNSLVKYKNTITLLKAFNAIKEDIPHQLVLVGGNTPFATNVLKPYIVENHLESRIVHFEKITDEELKSLYQYASLFVTPSLIEGFGATPIEAALCNTPVISTKETALYETTMGLLNYYEPATDSQALESKIREVLQNPPSQEELKKISTCFREQYDNRKIAKDVYEFITSVYENTVLPEESVFPPNEYK